MLSATVCRAPGRSSSLPPASNATWNASAPTIAYVTPLATRPARASPCVQSLRAARSGLLLGLPHPQGPILAPSSDGPGLEPELLGQPGQRVAIDGGGRLVRRVVPADLLRLAGSAVHGEERRPRDDLVPPAVLEAELCRRRLADVTQGIDLVEDRRDVRAHVRWSCLRDLGDRSGATREEDVGVDPVLVAGQDRPRASAGAVPDVPDLLVLDSVLLQDVDRPPQLLDVLHDQVPLDPKPGQALGELQPRVAGERRVDDQRHRAAPGQPGRLHDELPAIPARPVREDHSRERALARRLDQVGGHSVVAARAGVGDVADLDRIVAVHPPLVLELERGVAVVVEGAARLGLGVATAAREDEDERQDEADTFGHHGSMSEAIQIAGALAILVAYALAQFGVIDQRSYAYLIPNLLGAVVLAVIAWVEHLWGFFLLEVAWTLVSAWGLVARRRTKA